MRQRSLRGLRWASIENPPASLTLVRGFLGLLGIAVLGIWWLASMKGASIQPRAIFDASLLAGGLLLVGSLCLGRRSEIAWILGILASVVSTTVGLYATVGILFAAGIQFRPVLLILAALIVALGCISLAEVIRLAARYGATKLRGKAIASSAALTAVLGAASAGYGVWFGAVRGPIERPPMIEMTMELAPVEETEFARILEAKLSAKNAGDTRAMILGDVYNILTATYAETSDSYMCGMSTAIGDPMRPIQSCEPGPSPGLVVTSSGGRAFRGFTESWQVVQSGRTFAPGSWLEAGQAAMARFLVVAPKNAVVVRYVARMAIGRADQLQVVQTPSASGFCGAQDGVSLVYEVVPGDVVPGLLAAADPLQFEMTWHLGDGAGVELCSKQAGTFRPIPADDPRLNGILTELGLAYMTGETEAYWRKR